MSGGEGTTFVVMGTYGEYSDRQVWPACVTKWEGVSQALVVKFQSETRALIAQWKRLELDEYDDNFKEMLQRLFMALPDPSFTARYAKELDLINRMVTYGNPEDWSYYLVEVDAEPLPTPPLKDAAAALGGS
jgi:hypothetical protein